LPTLLLGRRMILKVATAICFCLFIAIVILSEARGAWIGFVGGLILMLLILMKGKRVEIRRGQFIAIAVLLVLMVGFVVVFSFPNPINRQNISIVGRFEELFHTQSDSIRERVLFYSVSADMIVDHPIFGMGPGMFQVRFFEYVEKLARRDTSGAMSHVALALRNRATDTAHNDFLQFWVETGTIGFMFFSFFLVSYFMTVVPSLSLASAGSDYMRLQCGIVAAVFCLAINASFSFPLHLPVRASLFWVLSSLSCSLYAANHNEGESVH
jgi:O-antigen ligase